MTAVQEIPPPEVSSPLRLRWPLALGLIAVLLPVLFLVTMPRLPAYEWSRQQIPSGGINLDSLVATNDGFAMLSGITSDGVLLWSLLEHGEWISLVLPGAPSQLTSLGDALVAYQIREGWLLERDNSGWSQSSGFEFPAEARSRQDSGRPSIVGNEDGMLVVGLEGDVWWTEDGKQFVTAVADPEWGPGVEQPFHPRCNPPRRSSPDVPPLVATTSGFASLVSSDPTEPFGIWPSCEPEVWISGDGATWESTDSIFTGGAYVYDLDWRDGRFIAVGGIGPGRPMVWTSENGSSWDELSVITGTRGTNLFRVEAGGAGWVVLGRDEMSREPIGWTSVDGDCWEPLPEMVSGGDAAVSRDRLMVLDRSGGPAMWTAEPSGQKGICQ